MNKNAPGRKILKVVEGPCVDTLHDIIARDPAYSVAIGDGTSKTLAGWQQKDRNGTYINGHRVDTDKFLVKSEVHEAAGFLFESNFFSADITALIKALGDTFIQGNSRFMKLESEYADKLAKAMWDAHEKDWVNPEMKNAIKIVLKSIMDSVQDPIIHEIKAELVFDEL